MIESPKFTAVSEDSELSRSCFASHHFHCYWNALWLSVLMGSVWFGTQLNAMVKVMTDLILLLTFIQHLHQISLQLVCTQGNRTNKVQNTVKRPILQHAEANQNMYLSHKMEMSNDIHLEMPHVKQSRLAAKLREEMRGKHSKQALGKKKKNSS